MLYNHILAYRSQRWVIRRKICFEEGFHLNWNRTTTERNALFDIKGKCCVGSPAWSSGTDKYCCSTYRSCRSLQSAATRSEAPRPPAAASHPGNSTRRTDTERRSAVAISVKPATVTIHYWVRYHSKTRFIKALTYIGISTAYLPRGFHVLCYKKLVCILRGNYLAE